MAKNSFYEWDADEANNTDVGGININEGCPAGNVNDGLRETMAQLKVGAQPIIKYSAKSGNYTALGEDHGTFFRFTATATLSLTAAVTLGANWSCYVYADAAVVTVDPNSSETINGQTTIILNSGQAALIVCTGTAFYAITLPNVTATGDVQISSSAPALRFVDTDTGALSLISASNSTGSLNISTDTTAAAADSAILFAVDGSEVARVMAGLPLAIGVTSAIDPTAGATDGISINSSYRMIRSVDGFQPFTQRRRSSDGIIQDFYRGILNVGNISVTTSATSFNTSSDARLKEELEDFDASGIIDAVKVWKYKWKSDGTTGYGVIAQDVYELYPQCVTVGEADDVMWSVDYSKFVPFLLKEVQNLRKRLAKIEGL